MSEAQKQYKGEKEYSPSKIKDRDLRDIQYKLKSLFKA